jgi:TIR domain
MTKIILSYRRADSDAIAGRIRDKLASHYGDDSVFMDIDSIPFGLDFREHVKTALLENDILIAVIGPKWIGPDSGNRTRINEETDPVRIEVETALRRDIPVVPVLVGGANMPAPTELPEGLKDLAFRNAAQIDAGRDFHQHMERLIRSMDRILELKSGRRPLPVTEKINSETPRGGSGEATPPRKPSPAAGRGAVRGALEKVLIESGLRFADAQTEAEFLAHYRERFYALGQGAIALAMAGWLMFGSTALVASQGKDLVSIRFFFIAAPILLVVFFVGFSKLAKRHWQLYYALTTLVFVILAYISARVLQGESWFRPEYVTMTFMAGIMVIGMAPVMTVYAVLLQCLLAAVALYYILYDLRMVDFPTLYAIFSSLFVGLSLLVGWCVTVTRERLVRREFAASQGLGRWKNV